MSNESVTNLEDHRRVTRVVDTPGDHRGRERYSYVTEALADAIRLLEDLEQPDALLVPLDELEFTARRVQRLLRGCVSAIYKAGER